MLVEHVPFKDRVEGSSPSEITYSYYFYIMKQYYNAQVPKSVAIKLQEKKCPYADKIDMGFTTPDIIDRIPTYAEVLDWLKELGFFISIHETINQGFVIASFDYDQCESSPHYKVGKTLREALDQLILFALEFI